MRIIIACDAVHATIAVPYNVPFLRGWFWRGCRRCLCVGSCPGYHLHMLPTTCSSTKATTPGSVLAPMSSHMARSISSCSSSLNNGSGSSNKHGASASKVVSNNASKSRNRSDNNGDAHAGGSLTICCDDWPMLCIDEMPNHCPMLRAQAK